jgi:hypothetical protein
LPIFQLQEMNYPRDAGLHINFREIELLRDIAVIQALAKQSIDGAKDSGLFPKAAHSMPPSRRHNRASYPVL